MLPMAVPGQVPQPAQGQPCPLQGRENKRLSSAWSRWVCTEQMHLSDAEQHCSPCSAFPVFLPLGQQPGIAKEQALYICAVVHTPLHHSLGLQGPGVSNGFTRNNPNPAELHLRADESCRTQSDCRGPDACNLHPYHSSFF